MIQDVNFLLVSHASVTIFIRLASWSFMVMFTHNKALSCKLLLESGLLSMDLQHMSLYFGKAHHIMHWPEFPSVFVGCSSYSIGFFLHRRGKAIKCLHQLAFCILKHPISLFCCFAYSKSYYLRKKKMQSENFLLGCFMPG